MTRQRAMESVRSLKMAAWLGWQIESNWTAPFLFVIYSIAKPIAGALILVLMYMVIAQGGLQHPLFPQIFVGNAFYIYVAMIFIGVSQAVVEDREHYGMLKYLYVAPLNIYAYLLGRGAAQAIVATVAVLIMLFFGIIVLGIPMPPASIDWGMLFAAWLFGLTGLAFQGILLGGIALITARHSFFVGEAVAGALYLLCGAVFPIDVLPKPLQILGQALPVTYWLEALRRALLGHGAGELLSSLSNPVLLLALAGSMVLLAVLSVGFYRWAENLAREKGLIDMQTMY
ncbi:MAG: ABC transporter permease [Dehalococcoidia bacterium]|nr:ABC transporter permease [Dehalococcoidia bacterium]